MRMAAKPAGLLLLACGLLPPPVHAQDAASAKSIMDNRQAALSVCIAYYTILQECASGEEALRARTVASDLTKRSQAAADAAGMSAADTAMRLELNLAMERGLIEGDCSRRRVLSSRFADQCTAAP